MLQFALFLLIGINCALADWPNFLLYTQNTSGLPDKVTLDNCKALLDLTKNFTILIHGFAASGYDDWVIDIKDGMLAKQHDLNIIAVDWQEGAKAPNYLAAKENMIKTAKKLNSLIQSCSIPPESIYCIGHSLGAHACGLSAKQLTFNRITGLDPAGPLFRTQDEQHRLASSDAHFVDIVNTDACLGLHKSIGHKNFYPNGGSNQPGCLNDLGICEFIDSFAPDFFIPRSLSVACSHVRAYHLYVDSLKANCTFKSALCKNYEQFEKGLCKCDMPSTCAEMGYHAQDDYVVGDFYLNTNKNEPYCKD